MLEQEAQEWLKGQIAFMCDEWPEIVASATLQNLINYICTGSPYEHVED